jgi:hypothetical protein
LLQQYAISKHSSKDITKVIAVANDLAEAVSEVETVADDLK